MQKPLPKSYASPDELVGLSQNAIYIVESMAAEDAGDEEASNQWLALAEIPAHALMACKKSAGADFIRSLGLNTADADRVYGPGWLDEVIPEGYFKPGRYNGKPT